MFQCKGCKAYIGMCFANIKLKAICFSYRKCPNCLIKEGNKAFAKASLEILEDPATKKWANEDKLCHDYYIKCKRKYEEILRN